MIRKQRSFVSLLRKRFDLTISVLMIVLIFGGCSRKKENTSQRERVRTLRVIRKELTSTNDKLHDLVEVQKKIESLEVNIQKKQQKIEELDNELQQTVNAVLR